MSKQWTHLNYAPPERPKLEDYFIRTGFYDLLPKIRTLSDFVHVFPTRHKLACYQMLELSCYATTILNKLYVISIQSYYFASAFK